MIDQLWKILLQLEHHISQYDDNISFVHLSSENVSFNNLGDENGAFSIYVFLIELGNYPTASTVFLLDDKNRLSLIQKGKLSSEALDFIKLYMPFCFSSLFAKRLGRAIVVAHFAQTLDGKIATQKGQSKWIGNEENLLHAHRMRALLKGITVGSGTIRHDNPRLNVRLCYGSDPVRIIIGDRLGSLKKLLEVSTAPIYVYGSISGEYSPPEGVHYIKIKSERGAIPTASVLEHLYKEGIYSVYLEGGPATTSSFLSEGTVDILQLHIAPLVFGSGVSAIFLPPIDQVHEALSFNGFNFYKIGDSIMFTGQPIYNL